MRPVIALRVVVVAVLATVGAAQSINVDIGGFYTLGSATNFGAATGQSGAWNTVAQASVQQVLVDTQGAATGATVSWAGPAPESGWLDLSGNVGKLLNDYQVLLQGTTAPVNWSIQGLQPGEYRVTFYSRPTSAQSTGVTRFTLAGGAAGAQDCDGAISEFFSGYRYGQHFVQDTTTVTNGTLSWSVELAAGVLGYFNGIQIESVVPGSVRTYCTAKMNSLGCTPVLASSGSPSILGGVFTVSASQVRSDRPGLLVWSPRQNGMPFRQGHLCVAAPLQRTATQSSGGTPGGGDCSGAYSFQWTTPYLASFGLTAGDTVACQFWSVDDGSPGNAGLTRGLEFTLAP